MSNVVAILQLEYEIVMDYKEYTGLRDELIKDGYNDQRLDEEFGVGWNMPTKVHLSYRRTNHADHK